MSDRRLPPRYSHRTERDQFKCLACKRFVTSSDHGVCPNCGTAPPTTIKSASRPDPRTWNQVVRDAHKLNIGPRYWFGVALFSIAVAFVAAALAVRLF